MTKLVGEKVRTRIWLAARGQLRPRGKNPPPPPRAPPFPQGNPAPPAGRGGYLRLPRPPGSPLQGCLHFFGRARLPANARSDRRGNRPATGGFHRMALRPRPSRRVRRRGIRLRADSVAHASTADGQEARPASLWP